MKGYFRMIWIPILLGFTAINAAAHCEIPCGIYDDGMRIKMMAEHISTIEKSMLEIVKLESSKPIVYNQLIRWVTNKEHHAQAFQEIVTQYFMTQRIKPDSKDYEKKIVLLHKMLVYAMKCKQTTDSANIAELRSLLDAFHDLYFGHEHQ